MKAICLFVNLLLFMPTPNPGATFIAIAIGGTKNIDSPGNTPVKFVPENY